MIPPHLRLITHHQEDIRHLNDIALYHGVNHRAAVERGDPRAYWRILENCTSGNRHLGTPLTTPNRTGR